jgi:flagellar biosynthesis/type III secretory pathway protein FliH
LAEDEAIGRGGCVVATADGHIDATLRTQLDRIVQTLLPGSRHEALAAGEGGEESA